MSIETEFGLTNFFPLLSDENTSKSRRQNMSTFLKAIFDGQEEKISTLEVVSELDEEYHPGCMKEWIFVHFSSNFQKSRFKEYDLPYEQGKKHLILAIRISESEVVHLVFRKSEVQYNVFFHADAFYFQEGVYIKMQPWVDIDANSPVKFKDLISQAIENDPQAKLDRQIDNNNKRAAIDTYLKTYRTLSLQEEEALKKAAQDKGASWASALFRTLSFRSSVVKSSTVPIPAPIDDPKEIPIKIGTYDKPIKEEILRMTPEVINLIIDFAGVSRTTP